MMPNMLMRRILHTKFTTEQPHILFHVRAFWVEVTLTTGTHSRIRAVCTWRCHGRSCPDRTRPAGPPYGTGR
eukprot:44482-Eustigmatos_ZCMA.PRE.1